MAENTQGASASEAKKSKVIKSLNREAERLDRFIVKHGDLPIGTPPDDEAAIMAENTQGESASRSRPIVCNDIQNLFDVVDEQITAAVAIIDAARVLCALERSPEHHDTHPDHNIKTGGGFAHGLKVCNDTLPAMLSHAGYLVESAVNDVDVMRESALREIEGAALIDAERRSQNVLYRLHLLCVEAVLVINPQADKPAADDAGRFLGWVAEQVKGGAA